MKFKIDFTNNKKIIKIIDIIGLLLEIFIICYIIYVLYTISNKPIIENKDLFKSILGVGYLIYSNIKKLK